MTDATPAYGWSGLAGNGQRMFALGAVPAETALTAIAAYAAQVDYAAALQADNLTRIPFAAQQANASAAMNAGCAMAITGGFSSSALGAPHWYGSKQTDQANLDTDMMAAAASPTTTADIVCSADNGATWSVLSHNGAQIVTLWTDFRTFRIAQQVKNRALQAEIAAATTPAALAAIVWA